MNGTLTATIARLFLVLAVLLYGPSSVFAQDRTLPLPPAAAVLTLSGLNFNLTSYMPRHFGGLFAHPPYVLRKVRYPASLAPDSIARGVAALDAALRETSGPVIVLAHSQGAQVASHWMREHANDFGAPSGERLVFLLTGNPLRAVGGYVMGRYDGWADWPADTGNRRAVEAARAGMMRLHTHYDVVDLFDPSHTVWTRGTTTFVLTREAPPLGRSRRGARSGADRNRTGLSSPAERSTPATAIEKAPPFDRRGFGDIYSSSLRAISAREAPIAVFTSFCSSGGGSTAFMPSEAIASSRHHPLEW